MPRSLQGGQGGDAGTHAPVALHQRRRCRVAELQVAGDPGGVVAAVEEPLAGQRGEADEDVALVLAAPLRELVLRRDARHHAEVGAALLDRREVDVHVAAGLPGEHRVAGLVDGDGVPLALDVLDVLGRAEVLEVLGLDHVLPGDDVAPLADGVDQRLVDQVLDRGAGGVGGDRRELVDLLGRQLVLDLGEVALVGAEPARLARVADPVDRGRSGPAAAAPGRAPRAGWSPSSPGSGTSAVAWAACRSARRSTPVDEPARLLEAGQLGEQRLQGAHAATARRRCRHARTGDGRARPASARSGVLERTPTAAREWARSRWS